MIEEKIAGKWKWHTVIYTFHSDGTYNYLNTESGIRTNGRYSIAGDIISFFIGSAFTSEISLQGDSLTLTPRTPQRGNPIIFTRVH